MTDVVETEDAPAAIIARRYVHDIFLVDHWAKLMKDLDMNKHRVALCLSSTMGDKYYIAQVLEEWDNAVRFMPEGDDPEPILVFKHCIEAIRIVTRPQRRRHE